MTGQASTPKIRIFSSLQNIAYRRIWIAAWFWYLNRAMEVTILSWLVLNLTDSPSQVALVGISRMSPMFILGLIAGSVADRFSKRKIMLYLQVVNIIVASITLVFIYTGGITPNKVFLSTFCLGLTWALDFATRRSYFATLFEDFQLPNAVSLDIALLFMSILIGPIISGFMISQWGFEFAYGILLLFYLLGLSILITVPREPELKQRSIKFGIVQQILEALTIIRTTRSLWSALTVTVALNFFGFPFFQMVPVIARDVLNSNALMYGALISASGLGSLIASLFIASKTIRRKHLLYFSGSLFMLVAIFIFSMSDIYLLSISSLILAGIGMSAFATMQPTIALQSVDPTLRGRAMGAIALGIGAAPPGMWILGKLSEITSPQFALTIMSITGFIVIVILGLLIPELRSKSSD